MIRIKDQSVFIEHKYFNVEILKKGATLQQLIFQKLPYIQGYDDPDNFDRTSKSAWLFPFPNRLAKGHFHHRGNDYYFPINDPKGVDNAIHGFVWDQGFDVVDTMDQKDGAVVTFQYIYDGHLEYFPYPFQLSITYQVDEVVKIRVKIENSGSDELPFGLGWHPYFLTDNMKDSTIFLPEAEKIEVDDNGIPTGVHTTDNLFVNGKKIGSTPYDTCYRIGPEKKYIRWNAVNRHLTMILADDWRYFQMYTPADRTSIALEPMTSSVDAFNNKEGLHFLPQGSTFETWVKLKINTELL